MNRQLACEKTITQNTTLIKSRRILFITIFLITNLFLLEAFAFTVGKNGLLAVFQTPKAYMKSGYDVSYVWWNEESKWGAWHQSNQIANHKSICFNATYSSNSIGARDTEFSIAKNNKKRIILIGDSFAEGWGLNNNQTLHHNIEKSSGFEVYNFGSAGDFGPLQYWILYRELAKNYSSDGVLILLYPANDFTDNDYNYWKATGLNKIPFSSKERHRPYFSKSIKPNDLTTYEFFIPSNSAKRSYLASNSYGGITTFFFDHFWSGNIVKTLRSSVLKNNIVDINPNAGEYSGYFDASFQQQQASLYFLKSLINEINVPVVVAAIPQEEDFKRARDKNGGGELEKLYWRSELKKLDRESKLFTFLDLIDYRSSVPPRPFFSCDSHWSPQGSIWAANIISNNWKLTKSGP